MLVNLLIYKSIQLSNSKNSYYMMCCLCYYVFVDDSFRSSSKSSAKKQEKTQKFQILKKLGYLYKVL